MTWRAKIYHKIEIICKIKIHIKRQNYEIKKKIDIPCHNICVL